MIDTDQQGLLRQTFRKLLTTAPPAELLTDLHSAGWLDVYDADPAVAVSAMFEVQGEELTTSSMLFALMHTVATAAQGHASDQNLSAAIVLPAFSAGTRPPVEVAADGTFRIDGSVCWPPPAGPLLAAVVGQEDSSWVLIQSRDMTISPVEGLDPSLGLARIIGHLSVAPAGTGVPEPADWADVIAVGRLAISHEIVGAARVGMELALHHSRQRVQFGRPIGSFQALQHRLADAKVALEVAEAALEEGWAFPGPDSAALAKALCGSAAREVTRQVQQVLGGIGFSWEFEFHRRLRRMLTLDCLLGSASEVEHEIGSALIAAGRVPSQRPL